MGEKVGKRFCGDCVLSGDVLSCLGEVLRGEDSGVGRVGETLRDRSCDDRAMNGDVTSCLGEPLRGEGQGVERVGETVRSGNAVSESVLFCRVAMAARGGGGGIPASFEYLLIIFAFGVGNLISGILLIW